MATRFQLGTISTQAAPSGAVQAFAGAAAPTGWLLCNGAAVSRATYAALFAAIASAHGSGDGSTTFNLPDYRGRIIRGVDGGIARDPDRAGRTAANAGGNTGDAVGSVQGEATKKNGMTVTNGASTGMSANTTHGHGLTDPGHGHSASIQGRVLASGGDNALSGLSGQNIGFPNTVPVFNNTTGMSVNTSASLEHTHTSNVTLNTGDNETRPINAYVNYIIKV
jgi:microcystin-dependent protein